MITVAEAIELSIVAMEAPAEPIFSMYINIGSSIALNITDTITAYIALFISPSPRSMPLAPFANMNPINPINSGVEYFSASFND